MNYHCVKLHHARNTRQLAKERTNICSQKLKQGRFLFYPSLKKLIVESILFKASPSMANFAYDLSKPDYKECLPISCSHDGSIVNAPKHSDAH